MKLLAIGNSFSEDATYYLNGLLNSFGIDITVVNLYIGGCSLERHWRNIELNAKDYMYQLNGVKTDRYVSIEDMLDEGGWDVIVTQQASHDSGWTETYEPFLGLITDYLRQRAPKARLYLQATWAYEADSPHPNFMRYSRSQAQMFFRVTAAYRTMAQKYSLGLIPCGELIQALRETDAFRPGGRSICRDGFHMHFLYGRYALALMWAKTIFNIDPLACRFVPRTEYLPGEEADGEVLNTVNRAAAKIK